MSEPRLIDNDIILEEIRLHLSQGKRVRLRAKGSSMHPFIHGSEDTLVLVASDRLRKGDVVLARVDGKRYVIHRIVGMNSDRITLMGDGNLYGKEVCLRSDIFGKVERIIRDGREYDIKSPRACLKAMAWRILLPLRRMKAKITTKIVRK